MSRFWGGVILFFWAVLKTFEGVFRTGLLLQNINIFLESSAQAQSIGILVG
jgi:hypothetical protein